MIVRMCLMIEKGTTDQPLELSAILSLVIDHDESILPKSWAP